MVGTTLTTRCALVCVTLTASVFAAEAMAEMEKVLLLLLGCAIQSDRKEDFVTHIKQLPLDIQHSIVDFIKDVSALSAHHTLRRISAQNRDV